MALAYFKYRVSPVDVTPFKSFPWIKAGSTERNIILHSITFEMPSGLMLVIHWKGRVSWGAMLLVTKSKRTQSYVWNDGKFEEKMKLKEKKKKVVKIAFKVWIAPHAKFTISDRADGWLAHDAPPHINHAVNFWQYV